MFRAIYLWTGIKVLHRQVKKIFQILENLTQKVKDLEKLKEKLQIFKEKRMKEQALIQSLKERLIQSENLRKKNEQRHKELYKKLEQRILQLEKNKNE